MRLHRLRGRRVEMIGREKKTEEEMGRGEEMGFGDGKQDNKNRSKLDTWQIDPAFRFEVTTDGPSPPSLPGDTPGLFKCKSPRHLGKNNSSNSVTALLARSRVNFSSAWPPPDDIIALRRSRV